MTRYEAHLPDGTIKTRNSDRTYTHAIAVRKPADPNHQGRPEWHCVAFCGSAELAQREVGKWQNARTSRADSAPYYAQVIAIAVRVAQPMPRPTIKTIKTKKDTQP